MSRTAGRRRALGQHFLAPGGVAERLVAEFAPRPGEAVLEVGPGRGVLTRALLEAGAEVLAIEVDPQLAQALRLELGARPDQERLRLVCADALKVDLGALLCDTFGSRAVRVLASLPYASGTAILERLCGAMPPIREAMVLLQKEVVDRVVAEPGTAAYGYLSVAVRSRCRAHGGFLVRPGAFLPPPRVLSRTLRVEPLEDPPVPPARRADFLALVGRLFTHRRKTLANNVRVAGLGAPVLEAARAAGDPARRPGEWSVEQLASLFLSLQGSGGSASGAVLK